MGAQLGAEHSEVRGWELSKLGGAKLDEEW
jgi:hypothetical protein